MSFIVVANFKSNLTQDQVKSWIKAVEPDPHMVIAPSFPHLSTIHDLSPRISLAAQDVSPFPPGSYTGAVSARELKELGVSYCIVGHSERRRYFHETEVDVAAKVRELVAVGITPLLCMDEKDISPQLIALERELYDECIYCFEPNGGIGGTTIASIEYIKKIQNQIRSIVPSARFIYGGSVTSENITSLLGIKLNGLLVASASLDPSSYLKIIAKVKNGT